MKKMIAVILLGGLVISCANNDKQKKDSLEKDTTIAVTETNSQDSLPESYYKLSGDTIGIQPFDIEIKLSPKAREKIEKSKETIIVDVFFTGTPKDGIKVELEEDGSFFVTSSKIEMLYGEVARFDNITFSKKIYDQLADKDIDLGVNVYSGRKSSQDNLLDVEPLFDKVSKVVNKKFTLKGKLIYGDD